MMRLTLAGREDLPHVLRLLNNAARKLHERGVDQWPNPFGEDRMGPPCDRGEVFLAWDGGTPAATITVSARGDTDFWRPRELAEPAAYVSKLARDAAYPGAGELLLRWVADAASRRGDLWVRLDAWRTNASLHAYYAKRGWQHKRTEEAPGRNSGALFQRLALPDPPARDSFTGQVTLPPAPTSRSSHPCLPGAAVVTQQWELGLVLSAQVPDWGHGITDASWTHGLGQPAPACTVGFADGSVATVLGSCLTELSACLARADRWPRKLATKQLVQVGSLTSASPPRAAGQ